MIDQHCPECQRVDASIQRAQNIVMGASETESDVRPVNWQHVAWQVFEALQAALHKQDCCRLGPRQEPEP